MRALLDVNVLIALLDAHHISHHLAQQWLSENASFGWASCPITQNGCIRVLSSPGYPNPVAVAAVAGRLQGAANGPAHEFWADDVSILAPQVVDILRVHGHRQVTDVYLLALAVSRAGRLVTFDRRIAVSTVVGADDEHLVTL